MRSKGEGGRVVCAPRAEAQRPLALYLLPLSEPCSDLTMKTMVCGQELRPVLFCLSHESSGPQLLAEQLSLECLRTARALVQVSAER
jgi:hypothetical protein